MTGRRPRRSTLSAGLLALALAALVPAVAAAHPLGNFTINHFAGIRVASERISLDVVIDRAEIPAFQERQRLDLDGDGAVGAAEMESERQVACGRLAGELDLVVGGTRRELTTAAAGISFPVGAGGLATMRLVCEYVAVLDVAIARSTAVTFADRSFAERIGWREIVVESDGLTVAGGQASAIDRSARLTSYPNDLLAQPLDLRSVAFEARPGGTSLPAWTAPDATPLLPGVDRASVQVGSDAFGVVPGGVGRELAGIIDAGGLNPALMIGSLLLAFGLGAAHALSPGHGKTIMAAYLVGTRGTARQAIGLGLAVTVAHTLGVLALAVITLLAANTLPPERLYPILGLVSGGLVIAIGGSLLVRRLQALWRARAAGHGHDHALGHGHEHPHEHPHAHPHPHGRQVAHGHEHPHGGEHPAPGSTVSWRSLFALGLSGGLVPSASALILLLGSIAAGRVAYGLVLVVAFGIGMAVVLGGVGFALVHASRLVSRLPRAGVLDRAWDVMQVATAAVVLVLGVFLTGQAMTQVL
ncbi:MAG: nickel/cobalt transporter [Chloroflexota bacterium]